MSLVASADAASRPLGHLDTYFRISGSGCAITLGCNWPKSLIPKQIRRIKPRGAARGEIARQRGCAQKNERDRGQRKGVGWGDGEEQVTQGRTDDHGATQPHEGADKHWSQSVDEDPTRHLMRRGAHRHSEPDIARAISYGIADYAIDTDYA